MENEISVLEAAIERDTSAVELFMWDAATAPHRAPRRDSLKKLVAALAQMPLRPGH